MLSEFLTSLAACRTASRPTCFRQTLMATNGREINPLQAGLRTGPRQKGRHSTRHVAIQAFSLRGWVFFCSPVGRGQKGPLFSHGFSQIKHGLTPSASVKIREDLWLLPAEPTRGYSPRSIPAGLGAEAPQKMLRLSPATAVPHSSRTPYFSNSSRGSTWLNKFRITASRLTYGTRPSSWLH